VSTETALLWLVALLVVVLQTMQLRQQVLVLAQVYLLEQFP
jgi:hypothetical protein